jgi:dTDP-4-amino-4,6-dideoxygalactose transaminase
MKVRYLNLADQWLEEKKRLLPIISKTLDTGYFVGVQGKEIQKFEKKISTFLGVKHVITVNSGTDAITLALHAAGIKKDDEVITVSNSYLATTGAIVHLGAKPVFVDVLKDQNIDPSKIEKKITKKTKAILPVHLTGRSCEMDKIMKIAKKYNLLVIEDCAQSFASKYKNKYCGTWGALGCFSSHPLKNLSGLGDGGFITTNNNKIAKYLYRTRNHGLRNRDEMDNFGYNSRMDNVQAAVLNFRLNRLRMIISKRRNNAKFYQLNLNKKHIFFPLENKNEFNTYHTFVIQVKNRNKLKKYLKNNFIDSYIHYRIPIHKQTPVKKLKLNNKNLIITENQSSNILSIPIHHNLSKAQLNFVVKKINQFFE